MPVKVHRRPAAFMYTFCDTMSPETRTSDQGGVGFPPMATEERYASLPDAHRPPLPIGRMIPIAVVVGALAITLAAGWHRNLSFETLARNRAVIDGFVAGHFSMAVAGFVALDVVVVGLSLPGAVMLTVAAGILFGWWVATLAVVAGATLGATLIFLIARTAFGSSLARRAGPRLARIAGGLKADAFSYLLFLRLMPVFPFWLVNLASAILGVELRTFVAATVIGIIPGTVTFTLVGEGLDSVFGLRSVAYRHCLAVGGHDCRLGIDMYAILTPQVIAALAALGLLSLIPLLVRRWRTRLTGTPSKS
jgi:uncharacterized membrane protein YdjX (TVP38/TMEM64 family)